MYDVWVRFKYGPNGTVTSIGTRCRGNTESALLNHLRTAYSCYQDPIIIQEIKWGNKVG